LVSEFKTTSYETESHELRSAPRHQHQLFKKTILRAGFSATNDSLTGQLQRACWNGLVFELLPDIVERLSPKSNCYTWEVTPAENFIDVKMGAVPYEVDYAMSVNPHCFLLEKNFT
jgi:hypothetical protein